MNWKQAIWRLVPLALAVAGVGCEQPPSPAPTKPPTEVGYVVLSPHPVTLLRELPGRTVAATRAEVRPQVGGIIVAQRFEEGSEVKVGQLLYRIDPRQYRAEVDRARAALSNARASVAAARLRSERYAELDRINAVSKQEADDAAASYQEALAAVEQQEASLASARIRLRYTDVTAPISGRIGISQVTEGALVTADQSEPLTTINDLSAMYVDFTQPSAELLELRRQLLRGSVQAGAQQVGLILEDGSHYEHPGELRSREVAVDEATGSVTLRAKFPNPDGLLLPGMFVRIRLEQAVIEDAITAPQRGVSRNERGQPVALVINAQDRIEARPLTTSEAVDTCWIVTHGLSAGDRLVVEGGGKVKPGDTVSAVKIDEAGKVASCDGQGGRAAVTGTDGPGGQTGGGAQGRSPAEGS